MIEVEHLSKSYGSLVAVRDVSFRVERGQVVGFLGPNGAGKTTTLRILAGFLGASSGSARVAGYDVFEDRLRARQSIGYMPEAAPLYPEMRAGEYLAFRAELKGVPRRQRRKEVERALGLAGARDMADVTNAHLSKGYRQRIGLADALLGSPPLLVLDEPTTGLDPNQMREVRLLLRELAAEHTILLSTHILSEVEATCDRAIVVARGRVVAEGTLAELRRLRHSSALLELHVSGDEEAALELVRKQRGVGTVTASELPGGAGHRLLVESAPVAERDEEPGASASNPSAPNRAATAGAGVGEPVGELAERLSSALAEARIGLRRLAPVATSLEQVFSELTAEPQETPPLEPAADQEAAP
jgi:ABC-2 type transport system ATP-binding protein